MLNQIAAFWFAILGEPHHLITTDVDRMDLPAGVDRTLLAGRSSLVRKTERGPHRVRGAGLLVRLRLERVPAKPAPFAGSACPRAWSKATAYRSPSSPPLPRQKSGTTRTSRFEQTAKLVGGDLAAELRDRSLAVFKSGSKYALERGIIIADTKFEWGRSTTAG